MIQLYCLAATVLLQ